MDVGVEEKKKTRDLGPFPEEQFHVKRKITAQGRETLR
jgi:hypothetical protein